MILRPGDRAPDFTVPNQHGSTFHLAEAVLGSAVVLAFVPFAFSPICGDEIGQLTRLQSEMRDQDRAVSMLAISVDSKYTLAAWSDAAGVDIELGSDFWPHGQVARAYGAFDSAHGVAERAVFAIAPGGTIVSGRQVARSSTRDFSEDVAAALGSL